MKEASRRRNLGEINAGMTKNYQDINDARKISFIHAEEPLLVLSTDNSSGSEIRLNYQSLLLSVKPENWSNLILSI